MSRTDSSDAIPARRSAGLGLAARFTLGLGLLSALFAAPAGFLLLSKARSINEQSWEKARLEMASETGGMLGRDVTVPEGLEVLGHPGKNGSRVQVAETAVQTPQGSEDVRLYRVIPANDEFQRNAVNLFAPREDDRTLSDQLIVLVVMVTGGLVLVVIAIGAVTARRVAAPLQSMIEDVTHISHGRLGHRIRSDHATGELAHLGRAMDRVVRDLVEGQEAEKSLEKSRREVEVLRELRRNLQPMTVDPPEGYSIETAMVEAKGAGTGDFVDALTDEEGRPTLIVGATAERGLPGALLMAMTRAYLRTAVLAGESPAASCDATNISLNRDLVRGLFASAMVARLEPATAQVDLVSAGHKAPAVRWDADAGELRKLQPNGIALGFDEGPIFRKSLETLSLTLGPGDALFLFSPDAFDVENAGEKKLGEAGVYALAKVALQEGMDVMERKLIGFLGGQPRVDLGFALLRNLQLPGMDLAAASATVERSDDDPVPA